MSMTGFSAGRPAGRSFRPLGLVLAAFAVLQLAPASAQTGAPWPNPAQSGPGQFPSAAPAAPAAQPPAAWPNQSAPAAQHPAWSQQPQRGAASGAPPCEAEFMPLREDAQKKGQAIRTLAERKAEREQLCQAFRSFVASEAKMLKFVTDNSARCGVPADAVKVMKANHSKSTGMRNQVCNVARAAPPPPPSLSDALGTSRIPDTSKVKRGGTFDTLSGGSLAR